MKHAKTFLLCTVVFASGILSAQDTIQKVTGEYIFGKVLDVSPTTVTYKKKGFEDGPSYSEELKTVANIRYKGVRRDDYKKSKLVSSVVYGTPNLVGNATPAPPSNERLPSVLAGSQTTQPGNGSSSPQTMGGNTETATGTPQTAGMPDNTGLANGPVSNQYRIEHFDKKYLINGQKVSIKAVDKLLAKSTNPGVAALAKSAKLLKNFQKATKIISYPSTIAGGFASIGSFSAMYKEIDKGGASFNSVKDFGLSFLGTLTGPLTSKFLKNRRDKMYDKAIDLYNFRN